MELLLGLKFISTEFVVSDFRLDSVAYDEAANSFVIIEYKNAKNVSVIDQGYTYLATMFNHKADFVLEYNRITGNTLGINDIEWSQTIAIFISPSYNKFQINSINFKDLPIELWKIKKYSNNTVLFEEIKPKTTTARIKEIAPSFESEKSRNSKVETEIYDEVSCIGNANQDIIELYEDLRDYITDLDEGIRPKYNKHYIAFVYKNKNFVSLAVRKNSITMYLYAKYDSLGLIEDVSYRGHYGRGGCQVKIFNREHIGSIQDILNKHFEFQKNQ